MGDNLILVEHPKAQHALGKIFEYSLFENDNTPHILSSGSEPHNEDAYILGYKDHWILCINTNLTEVKHSPHDVFWLLVHWKICYISVFVHIFKSRKSISAF